MTDLSAIDYTSSQKSRVIFTTVDEVRKLERDLTMYDRNVWDLYAHTDTEKSVVIPSGETYKNISQIENMIHKAAGLSLARDNVILGFGGGVVCDMTALAASLYMRGCRLVLVPTTLLAMVDAAIGGKTGVDYGGYKNLIGSFYPAETVCICMDYLQTLDEVQRKSGLAEVIKTAILGDDVLLELLETRSENIKAFEENAIREVVKRCARVKCVIVQDDLKEHGKRAILNLGHTFGHALEGATNFSRYTHGEAVIWGIRCAVRAGLAAGITTPEFGKRITRILDMYEYRKLEPGIQPEVLYQIMQHDKKKKDDKLRFIIPGAKAGDIKMTGLDKKTVLESMKVS